MKVSYFPLTFLATFSVILAYIRAESITSATTTTTAVPQPVYKPADNYVPHATYPYAETYPVSGYDGFIVPAGSVQYQNTQNDIENDNTSLSNVPVSF